MRFPTPPLRIVFATPAYWPAVDFGGPIVVFRELAGALRARGHEVAVVTSSLESLRVRQARHARSGTVEGIAVRYLATPLRYRWVAVPVGVRSALRSLGGVDVVHVFGYRDGVGTSAARWCTLHGVPYVFEALGMFRPKLRKVGLKRVLDAAVFGRVVRGAARIVATSRFERTEYLEAGVDGERVAVRPNGFPTPRPELRGNGSLRRRLHLDSATPLVLYVGRIADGKGLEFLVDAAGRLGSAHVAIVGPDDGHGTTQALFRRGRQLGVGGRVHLVPPPSEQPPLSYFADADVFVLPSAHENFGLVAAEAASVGTPLVVTNRCGVADVVGGRAALVVDYASGAVGDAVATLLDDAELRSRLGRGGLEVAREHGWPAVAERQEAIYRSALESRA